MRSDNGYLLVVTPEALDPELLRKLTIPEDGRKPQGIVLEVPGVDPRITVETDGAAVALKADFDPEHKAWHACLKDPTDEWTVANDDPAWERNIDAWEWMGDVDRRKEEAQERALVEERERAEKRAKSNIPLPPGPPVY